MTFISWGRSFKSTGRLFILSKQGFISSWRGFITLGRLFFSSWRHFFLSAVVRTRTISSWPDDISFVLTRSMQGCHSIKLTHFSRSCLSASVFWLRHPVPRAVFTAKPSTSWLKPTSLITMGQYRYLMHAFEANTRYRRQYCHHTSRVWSIFCTMIIILLWITIHIPKRAILLADAHGLLCSNLI